MAQHLKSVSKQVDHVESDKHISFSSDVVEIFSILTLSATNEITDQHSKQTEKKQSSYCTMIY